MGSLADFIYKLILPLGALTLLINALIELVKKFKDLRRELFPPDQSPSSSAKIAKRSMLLASTALGLVLIGHAVVYYANASFIFGNGIILSGSIFALIRGMGAQYATVPKSFFGIVFGWLIWLWPRHGGLGCC